MAEVLGVVASGINIASLVGGILKVGFKTSELLKEVQQYPAEIAHRLQDLQLLALSLSQSGKIQPALPSQTALEHARLQCQRCLNELQIALEDFSAQISNARGLRRSITVTKVVLKKDTLDRLERRLKYAFESLMLAHQVYLIHVVQAEGQSVQGYLTKAIKSVYHQQSRRSMNFRTPSEKGDLNHPTIRRDVVGPVSSESIRSYKLLVIGIAALTGMTEIEMQYRKQDRKMPNAMVTEIGTELAETVFELILRLAPPHWVSFYLMEFRLGVQHSSLRIGLCLNFRPRNVQFDDADGHFDLLLESIYNDDIGALSRQLEGQAGYLLDDDDYSGELMFSAICALRWSICNLLLDRGARLHTMELGEGYWEVFPEFTSGGVYITDCIHGFTAPWWHPDEESHGDNVVQLLKFMRRKDQEDDLIATLFEHYEGTAASFNGVRRSIWSDEEYYDITFSIERMKVAISLALGARITPHQTAEMVRVSLCPQGNFSGAEFDLSITDNKGNNLLHCLAGVIGHLEGRESTQEWCTLIQELVTKAPNKELALQLPGRSHGPYYDTPLIQLIQHTLRPQRTTDNPTLEARQSRCQSAAMHWLEALRAGGVDLASYGREERLFMSQYSSKRDFVIVSETCVVVRLINFEFGPSPSQWRFYWSQETDEFAGQFWTLVEAGLGVSRVPKMPGSWPDEESDFEET